MENKLTIDLTKLESTAPVQENELICKDAFLELCKIIASKVKANLTKESAEEFEEESDECLQWNNTCFFINGGRGSGKSTLLRAVGKRLESGKEGIEMPRLASVDPTELAETESFFIHILSRISKKLTSVDSSLYNSKNKRGQIEKAYDLFQKMAKGLKLLGQKDSEELYELDAHFFLSESVEQCTSSADLKNCFRQLIKCLCKIFNVKAFYITIDDADMNFNKCREILETIRTYMLAPQLAFIFAGDLKLYSLVIRAMQIGYFGQTCLQYDGERETQRKKLLDQLEEQYLVKMFPNENRANLLNFSAAMAQDASLIYAIPEGEKKVETIKEFLYQKLSSLAPRIARERIINYLGGLPTRTALQLLKFWAVNHDARAIAKGIMLTFSTSLTKYDVNYVAISSDDYGVLLRNIVIQLRNDRTMYAASLIPQDGSDDKDHVIFYLNAETEYQTRSVKNKIRYLFRTFPAMRYPELREYINKVADDKEWAALCTAAADPAIRGSNSKRYGNGVIRLLKDDVKDEAKEGEKSVEKLAFSFSSYLKKLCGCIIKCFRHGNEAQKDDILMYCLAINHSLCKVYEKREAGIYLSVYSFMALIEKCLAIRIDGHDENTRLNAIAQIKECIEPCLTMPVAFKNSGDNEKSDAPSEVTETERDKGFANHFETIMKANAYPAALEHIASKIYDWLKVMPNEYSTNASQLSDCWQRIMSRQETATDSAALSLKKGKKIAKAGQLFSQYLKAVNSAVSASLVDRINVQGENSKTSQGTFGAYLETFPLMKALCYEENTKEDSYEDVRQLTNAINIGVKYVEPVVNRTLKTSTNK